MALSFMEKYEVDMFTVHSDRFTEFMKNSCYIQKLLYNKDYSPSIYKRSFSGKLTADPANGNLDLLQQIIMANNGTKTLVIAPTGSGKTYSVNSVFQNLKEQRDSKQLLVLLCPNKIQNIQNANSDNYDFEALVEGVLLEENENNTRQLSSVYDKIPSIIKFKKEHPDYSLRIIIDECQTLVSASKFREKTIATILKLINDGLADSYTFVTATYDSMAGLAFDNIVLFEDENYKPVFKSINLLYSSEKFADMLMHSAKTETKPYIRLNDKKMIKQVETALLNESIKCYSVTSDDKGYRRNEDGSVTYTNPIFDHVTNNDDLYNVGDDEANVILASSLLDAGTNFTRYDQSSTPVFAVETSLMMNIDEIEQSYNRFRLQKDATGVPIYLDHASLIQQNPRIMFSRAIISHIDESGLRVEDKSIPGSAIKYDEGYTAGTTDVYTRLSLSIIYIKDLAPGRYEINYYIDNEMIHTNSLYIDTPVNTLSVEEGAQIVTKLQELLKASSEDESLINSYSYELLKYTDSIFPEYAFQYSSANADDDAVICLSSKIIRPMFSTLVGLMEKYTKLAKQQLAIFHNYMIAQDLANSGSNTSNGVVRTVSIELPSLEVNPMVGNIKTVTGTGNKSISIKALVGQKINLTKNGKTLYSINTNERNVTVTVFEDRFPGNGAECEIDPTTLTISSAANEDDAAKNNFIFNRMNTDSFTINDTFHKLNVIVYADAKNSVGGISQLEYLESMLTVYQSINPTIGSALEFDYNMRLRIDYVKLFHSAYSTYQNQYYYHPAKLKEELERRLSIPVSITQYVPDSYCLEKEEENREYLVESLYNMFKDPIQKPIAHTVLYMGQSIPADAPEDLRQSLAEMLRSDFYKKEFLELRKMDMLSFDYIVEVLNCCEKAADTNKHIKRLQYMIINQAIVRNAAMPFSTKELKKQYEEQKALITAVEKRRAATGTKKFTLTDSFKESLIQDFTTEMIKTNPKFKAPSKARFNHLLLNVYKIANLNITSRKPELVEPIITVEDIPLGKVSL